ncbi:MAG: glycosyltransferase family 39 protein [Chloroflexota bacterium]
MGLDIFVTADEQAWLQRSIDFAGALVRQSWRETFQFEHPAVTTMWLGTLGIMQNIPMYLEQITTNPEPFQRPFQFWLEDETGVTRIALLASTRWWVTMGIALTCTSTYFPLRRLLGTPITTLALLLAAWSPMVVGFSRQLQPDGFLASTMFASLIFFLAWLYDEKGGHRNLLYLIISGVMMGLAWLTKTPAAFLVPTGGLLLLWQIVYERHRWRFYVVNYVVWGAIASVAYFALWPAMWVDPLGVFTQIYRTMTEYSVAHVNPNFFWGHIVEDPGHFFYPAAYLFRTTPAVFIGLIAALVAGAGRYGPFQNKTTRRTTVGVIVFVLLFTGCMTLIGKKFDRYLLPVFLALDVVAALGLYSLAQFIAQWFTRLSKLESITQADTARSTGIIQLTLITLALLFLHGIYTAQHYPYYMTYFNPVMGGTDEAPARMFVGWGEGLEQVGAWLNEQPDAERIHAISWYAPGSLSFFFEGTSISVLHGSRMPWLDVKYVVLYINQIQRNIPTANIIQYFTREQSVFEVESNGLTLARVYDMELLLGKLAENTPPLEDIAYTQQWPDFQLTGIQTLPLAQIPAALPIALTFDQESDLSQSYKVSLRFVGDTGTLIAQRDVPLTPEVRVQLYVPPDALPAPYDLFMMVYDEQTLSPVPTIDGQELIKLTTITVTEPY